jgi:dTDP-4-dehydrorhamnose reductase
MTSLIFGANGMLGYYVSNQLKNAITITRKEFDIETQLWSNLKNILITHKPKVVINCAGLIPQRADTVQNKKYFIINSLFPHVLSIYCNEMNIRCIHITTDCVFSGDAGQYTEQTHHSETNMYGISKSIGEPENTTNIRTSIIGHEIENKKSLLEWIISQKNNKINGYSNHYWNGVTCLQLAKIIEQIIRENRFWVGVRHIHSPDIVSKYELANIINDTYKLNITVNNYTTSTTINKSLSSIYENDFQIPPIKTQIEELYAHYNNSNEFK